MSAQDSRPGYCYHCNTRETLFLICPSMPREAAISYACLECRAQILASRKCTSKKDKCKQGEQRLCLDCHETYDHCRAVVIRYKPDLDQVSSDPWPTKTVCPVCASPPVPLVKWWCISDYLDDHSRARCCDCGTINLSVGKYYGRGPCCK